MKGAPLLFACLTFFLGGCMLVPSPYSAQLNPAVARYRAIQHGTPRFDLEAQLGQAARKEADGACVWETRFDQRNYATLKVWFDPEEKVREMEITKAHGASYPGFHAQATDTNSK